VRVTEFPFTDASFRIWQCAFVSRHLIRFDHPSYSRTSFVMDEGQESVSDRWYPVIKAFHYSPSFVVVLTRTLRAGRALFLFPWSIGHFVCSTGWVDISWCLRKF